MRRREFFGVVGGATAWPLAARAQQTGKVLRIGLVSGLPRSSPLWTSEQNKGERITVPFDMLHVSPPQSPPEEIKSSPLVNAAGWVEVNQNSMQHVRYPNVFSLGDVSSTPNSKTAAAVRKQAPVVVDNILHMMGKRAVGGGYDGYASCPLTTAFGKAILAEFIYGGKVTPTLPLNPAKEYWIKVTGLPLMYWNYMLKGHVWFPKHNTAFKGDVV